MELKSEKELKTYGFQYLTSWEIRNGKIKSRVLGWDDCAGWIYSFVTGDKVRYIGISTTVLRSRLDGYSYQINDRVGALIKNALDNGEDVKILGVKRPGIDKLDLETEESALIAEYEPDWNVRS